jgi:hypothetical protein
MSTPISSRLKRLGLPALLNIVLIAMALLTIEGLSSIVLFGMAVANVKTLAERRHTRYDALLGWSNIPNIYLKDMYGPGVSLRINGQGFRGDHDYSVEVPSGKKRIICAGDSFTFGYGVSDHETWCQRLSSQDTHLETVNMGQGGYGIDQTYLWYKRDAGKLRHNILLFAFNTKDFGRMRYKQFHGYYKPLLTVQDNVLTVTRVPVPRRSAVAHWLIQRRTVIDDLRAFQLASTLFTSPADSGDLREADAQRTQEMLAGKIFADVAKLAQARNSTLILVYLPSALITDEDLRWQNVVHDIARREGIQLIDLVNLFDTLPSAAHAALFIPEEKLGYRGAAGHYTAAANQIVARALRLQLNQVAAFGAVTAQSGKQDSTH